MAGISDKAIKTSYAENKFRYNEGTELQNKEFSDGTGLEVYDAGFRTLDPQLGRFSQIDPLADYAAAYSTYAYGGDNPVTNVDPEGLKEDPFTAMTSLLNTQYGGTWNAQDGSEQYYVSGDESFAMGAMYVGQNGGWGSPGTVSSFDQALYNYNGGTITSGMAATLFSVTWGSTGQATDVSAEDLNGGFNISGTATSDGGAITDYFVSDDFVRGAFENLGEGNPNSSHGAHESGEFMETFFTGDEFLDKGFTANDLMSVIGKLAESPIVEKTATIVSGVAAAHSISQGVESFKQGDISTGIYKTVVGSSTLVGIGAVALGILAPEALLFWGASVLISDTIIGMSKGKSFSQALLGN